MAKLVNTNSGDVLIDQLEIADTFWKRFKGLQFRHSIPHGSGLLLSPCSSLHTCFMRFPIDVIHLDDKNRVLGISRNIRPWRLHFCPPGTHQVIETNPETVAMLADDSVQLV